MLNFLQYYSLFTVMSKSTTNFHYGYYKHFTVYNHPYKFHSNLDLCVLHWTLLSWWKTTKNTNLKNLLSPSELSFEKKVCWIFGKIHIETQKVCFFLNTIFCHFLNCQQVSVYSIWTWKKETHDKWITWCTCNMIDSCFPSVIW